MRDECDHGSLRRNGVAIRVAGHCRVCNPHYSYDEQFQIEHHHEADTGRWEGLNA